MADKVRDALTKRDYRLDGNLPTAPSPTEQIRLDAVAYLTRTDNADLLDVLGLVEPAEQRCPHCRRKLRMEPTRPDGAPRCPSAICREQRRSLKA